MFQQTPKKRVLFVRRFIPALLVFFGVFSLLVINLHSPRLAQAATSSVLNFQARLETSAGSIAPDGNYNVEFKLYSASSGGSALWTEDYLNSASQGIHTANGYLTANLGSITAFPTTINWDQQLWITMTVRGTGSCAFAACTPTDAEMSPRLQLTAVPYAFKAGQLAQYNSTSGYTSTLQLLQPTGGNQIFQIPDQGAAGTFNLLTQNSGIQNGTSLQTSANFNIDSTGKAATFNATSALQTAGVTRVDSSGNLTNIGNISGSGTLQLSGTTGSSYIMSALGLGTSNPQAGSVLTIANGSWISGVDAAGTGFINLFQLNSSNQIQVGASLNVDGSIVLPTNGGQLTFADLPIDTSATAGTAESYTLRVGSANALTVYGEADGSGNAQNVRVAIGSSISPAYTLDVGGDINSSSALRVGGTSICTSTGCVVSPTSGVQLQGSTPGTVQTGNFNITGTGIAGTLQAGTIDTSSAGALTIGSTNATAINLSQSTTIAANKSLTVDTNTLTVSGGGHNVGIGVSPSAKLDVSSSSLVVLKLNQAGASDLFDLYTNSIQSAKFSSTGQLTLGTIAVSGTVYQGSLSLSDGTIDGYKTTITTNTLTGNQAISLPNATGTVALTNDTTNFIRNQITQQTGSNFNIDGTGIAGTLQAGTIDTSSAGALTIGNTNATSIAIGKTTSNIATTINGTAIVKPVSDSATVFQIQNAAGTQLLNVDSTSPDLITNGSLEQNTTGWVAKGGATLSQVSSQHLYGANALQIAASANGDGAKYNVTLTAGTQYIVSFYARTDSSTSTINFGYACNGADETAAVCAGTASIGNNIPSSAGWNRYSLSFTPSAVSGTPYFFIKQTASTSRNIWLDGVDLEASPSGNVFPYREGNIQVTTAINSPLAIMPSTDSVNAFQVVDSAGNNLFAVDTKNGRVGIGASPNTTARLYTTVTSSTTVVARFNQGSTANILELQGSGTNVLTVGSTGNTLIQTSTDSATALQVLSSGSVSVLTADTLNKRVSVGTNGTATGQLYVGGSVPSSSFGSVATGVKPRGIAIQGRYAYQVSETAATLQVFDISNPASPTSVGSVATGTSPYNIAVAGHYAYVNNYGSATLQVFDISNPASPTSVGSVATGTNPAAVVISGRYAYLINFTSNTLQVIDIKNPASPTVVGSVATATGPNALVVQGRYVYVTNQTTASLQIFDVSNPASPALAGSTSTNTAPFSVAVVGRYAYITSFSANVLQIFDVSNPASPSNAGLGAVATAANPDGVVVQGRYAYVTTFTGNTLQVIDINNPVSPASIGTVTTGTGPISPVIQGRYVYLSNYSSTTMTSYDVGGSYIQLLEAGGAELGTLSVNGNSTLAGNAAIQGGLQIGQSLQVAGNAGFNSTLAVQTATNSTTAFQVQNSSGTSVLNTDTTNGKVTISGTTDSTELVIKAYASQSVGNPLIMLQDSTGSELLRLSGTTSNTSLGYQAGKSNAGSTNTLIGSSAGTNITFGTGNTALGSGSLLTNATSNANVAIGSNALTLATSGNNTAVGYNALNATNTGANNTALGYSALTPNTTGSQNTAVGYKAGYQDSSGSFQTTAALQNATALGAYAQVQASNSIVLGSIDTATNVGIGTTIPLNTFSVSPVYYSTGLAAVTSTAPNTGAGGTTVTGSSGASWAAAMVGMQFIFANGQTGTVQSVTDATHLVLTVSQPITSAQAYRIHTVGFQVTSAGNTFVQNTSTTAFQIQNSAGTALLTADTTNGTLTVGAGKSISITGGITSSRPSSPTEGMLYYDTTTKQLLVYANGKWQADRAEATKIVADGSTTPNPDNADYVVPAGNTNAQSTINAAITALGANGGTVFLRQGTYTVDATSSSITIPSNVALIGEGASTVIQIKASLGASYNVIVNTNASNNGNDHITLRDFKIDGNIATNNANTINGIVFTHVGTGSGSSAVPGATITGLYIEGVRSAGIDFESNANGGSANNVVSGNHFFKVNSGWAIIFNHTNTTDAVNINNQNQISGNVLNGGKGGIQLLGGINNVISGNVVDGFLGFAGIQVGSSATNAAAPYNIVTGNNVANGSITNIPGIQFDTANYGTITGNSVSNLTATTDRGIDLKNATSYTTVSGNTIANVGADGIRLDGGVSNNITGNKIDTFATQTAASQGILITTAGANNNSITNNDITLGNTGNAISITTGTANYLGGNRYSGTGATTINDAGTGTIYGSQTSGNNILIQPASTGNVILGGSPTNTATTSFLQVGTNPISGGNISANGGTYIGLNAPSSGAGSAADLVNLQKNNATVIRVDTNGAATFTNAANSINAFQVQNAAGATTLNISTSSTPNLVSNASMESNINGWLAKGTGVVSLDDTQFLYGKRSVKIVTGTAANNGGAYSVPLKASTQYSLSVWLRRDASTTSTINIGRQDNAADVDCLTGQTVNTTWTQFTCTFTTGATINDTTNLYIKQTDTTTDNIFVDGMTLVQAATAQAFSAGGNNIQVDNLSSNITLNNTNTGELQPWQLNANPLPDVLQVSTAVTANGYVYNIGGANASVVQSAVYYAKLNADGSVGAWTTNTNTLPAARQQATSVVANGYVYVMGGFNVSAQTSVYYAKLNADGSTGAWNTNTNVLPAARYGATSVAANGYVYVMGGLTPAQTSVYYAKLNADGSTGAWNTTTVLPAARDSATSVAANGYVYVMGGTTSSTIYYAKLNADGTVGAWSTNTTNPLPANRVSASSVVANGYVYVMGGFNGTAQTIVYYAKLNADGSVGAWSTNTNALPSGRQSATSVTANGYVYFLGGWNGAAATSTVWYSSTARIQLGGSLDLIGLSSGNLAEGGGTGGSLTAGNTFISGQFQVTDQATFANAASIDKELAVHGSALFQNTANSAIAFQIQNATNVTVLNVDTSTSTIRLGTSTDNMTLSAGTFEPVLNGNARHAKSLVLTPEFAGAVLDAANDTGGSVNCSTNNNGTMTSSLDLTNRMNYYNWTSASGTAQCYDVVAQIAIPSDWAAWASTTPFSVQLYTDSTTNGQYAMEVRNSSGTAETSTASWASIASLGSANTWTGVSPSTLGSTTTGYTAGNYLTLRIRVSAKSSANIKVGNITLNYLSKY